MISSDSQKPSRRAAEDEADAARVQSALLGSAGEPLEGHRHVFSVLAQGWLLIALGALALGALLAGLLFLWADVG